MLMPTTSTLREANTAAALWKIPSATSKSTSLRTYRPSIAKTAYTLTLISSSPAVTGVEASSIIANES